jgi:hypothetical protein
MVIIPLQYKFLKNQYRLNNSHSTTQPKAGFTFFIKMKILTVDYSDHCSLFYADVEKKAVF